MKALSMDLRERILAAVLEGNAIHAIDCHGSRASMIANGPTNPWVFEAYVDWLLAPTLRPGDILSMDNLSSHKNPSTLEKIKATGAEVRLVTSTLQCLAFEIDNLKL